MNEYFPSVGATRRPLVAALLSGAVLLLPGGGSAQDHSHEQPPWVEDLGVAGANVLTGALTAAVTAAIRGHDIPEAFLRGAVGGGVVFLGKRVAVERFGGAGLLGREIAAVGTSVVVNGGDGRGWLNEVWLPVGPAWVQVRPRERLRARVNLLDVGMLVWATTRPELRFDLERSISNGATVFVADRHRIVNGSNGVNGLALGGVIALGASNLDMGTTQAHENIHVIQHDYLLHSVTRPIERWGWGWITEREVPADLNLLRLFLYPRFLRDAHESEAQVLELR